MMEEKIQEWNNAMSLWKNRKVHYKDFTSVPLHLIVFLEQYMYKTYHDNLRQIVLILRKTYTENVKIPLSCYILEMASMIEPLINQKLCMTIEMNYYSKREEQLKNKDALVYLMSRGIYTNQQQFERDLINEIHVIGNIVLTQHGE